MTSSREMPPQNCQEWRTTIEVMLLKQQSQDHTVCRWVSTAIVLADCLAKPMDATFLRTVLNLGRFRIYSEDQTLRQNANRKYGVTWINNRISKFSQCDFRSAFQLCLDLRLFHVIWGRDISSCGCQWQLAQGHVWGTGEKKGGAHAIAWCADWVLTLFTLGCGHPYWNSGWGQLLELGWIFGWYIYIYKYIYI